MPAQAEFVFSETEIYQALRLTLSDDEAREQAGAVARAALPGMDWASSEEFLLLLSLGSEGGHAKVQHLRREEQASRYSTWTRQQRDVRPEAPRAGTDDLQQRWNELVAAEDRAWYERREARKRVLREEGRLPPGTD